MPVSTAVNSRPWKNDRERVLATALGFVVSATHIERVRLPVGQHTVEVLGVAPASGRELALWELLATPEEEWAVA